MAVPNSGLIKFSGIAAELVNDDYTDADFDDLLTLKDMSVGGNTNGSSENFDSINSNSSSKPDSSAPYKMSEFYSYDHDASSGLTSFSSSERQTKAACGYGTNLQETYYHDASTAVPNYADNVYSDSSGNTPLQAGQYKIGPFVSTYYNIVVSGNSGGISSRQTCTG